MNRQRLEIRLLHSEGLRLKPYEDTTGHWTIGVGRNLTDVGITEEEAMYLLGHDIEKAFVITWEIFANPFYQQNVGIRQDFTENRQDALVEMAFNLGEAGLRRFRKMIAAVERGDWTQAASEALNSRWAEQVGSRANRIARDLKDG